MKTAIITGANRGLGFACAEMLLQNDVQVIMTGRDREKLDSATADLNAKYNSSLIHSYVCDVSDADSVRTFGKEVSKDFEQISLLVNNAGIIGDSSAFPHTTEEELQRVIDVNVFGSYRMAQACTTLLKKSSEAMIINVSSGMGSHDKGTGSTSYRLSKFALNGMTTIMNNQLQDNGIGVVSVCPGWVHTDMGGPSAPRTPEQGASSILAPFLNKLPAGGFYRDGESIAW